MKIKKLMQCLLSAAFLLMVFSPVAYGDLYWESIAVHGGTLKGLPKGFPKGMPKDLPQGMPKGLPRDLPKPPKHPGMTRSGSGPETIKNYLTSYGSRIETKDDITIILFDDMTIYQLDPSTGTYIKIKMSEMEESMGPMAKMSEDAKIMATGETKTIKGFKCEKYIMTFMGVENVQWLSKDVTGYDEYEKISKKVMRNSPQFRKMGLSGSLSGKGFPVKMESGVMGMTTTTTLQKIEKTSLSKDLFKVPAGYVQKPLNLPIHK
ncbi:MAG: DUF4412 domain-containing protein [Deltaproteobacteria bacterium]|nr:DUF4412 domain-containing protein [Deltaproteobacteria bacterium]